MGGEGWDLRTLTTVTSSGGYLWVAHGKSEGVTTPLTSFLLLRYPGLRDPREGWRGPT